MKHLCFTLLACCSLVLPWPAGTAAAGPSELTVHLGPPGVGSGGANPLSIPPINPLEYEVEYIAPSGYEGCFSISPGLFFGKRAKIAGSGAYVGLGGGAVIDTNGAGPGIYSSLGYNVGSKTVMFNAEVKQAIGFDVSHRGLLNPYAIRLGMTFAL